MSETSLAALSELKVQSKDCKSLVTTLIEFLTEFQESQKEMVQQIKTDLLLKLEEKDSKINSLQTEISTLKKQVFKLEERIEDSEAYERRDAVIISGSKVPPPRENEDCVQVVRNLTRQYLNLSIPENEISIAHTLGSSNSSSNKRSIIVKFCRRNMKSDVINAARKQKVQNFYVNECLTPTQRTIGFVLRKAKRQFPEIISGSTTFEGKHHVWTKAPNPTARGARDTKHIISSYDRLEKFCTSMLNKPASEFQEK